MKQLRSIQYLRGIAAIVVVIYHEAEDSTQWFDVGAYGVDLFFLISGFIMFAITASEERRPQQFFSKRLTRIVPLYWSITLLSVFLCYVHPNLMWDEDTSLRHLLLSLFFIPDRPALGDEILPTLLQGWTLNIEMFFYIVMALALFLPRRFQVMTVSVVLLGLVAVGFRHHPNSAILTVHTDPHMAEFVGGVWIGRLWTSGRLPGPALATLLLGGGVAIFGVAQVHGMELWAPLAGVPAAFILFGAVAMEEKGVLPRSAVLKILGDASYSIYLSHSLVQAVINRTHLPVVPKAGCAILLSLVGGVLVFLWFERPLNRLVRRVFAVKNAARPVAAI